MHRVCATRAMIQFIARLSFKRGDASGVQEILDGKISQRAIVIGESGDINTLITSTADTTFTNTVTKTIINNKYRRQIKKSGERVDVMHYHYTVSGNFQGRWAQATSMYKQIMQEEERISYVTVLRSPRSHFLSYYYYYVQPEVQVSLPPPACLPRPVSLGAFFSLVRRPVRMTCLRVCSCVLFLGSGSNIYIDQWVRYWLYPLSYPPEDAAGMCLGSEGVHGVATPARNVSNGPFPSPPWPLRMFGSHSCEHRFFAQGSPTQCRVRSKPRRKTLGTFPGTVVPLN